MPNIWTVDEDDDPGTAHTADTETDETSKQDQQNFVAGTMESDHLDKPSFLRRLAAGHKDQSDQNRDK